MKCLFRFNNYLSCAVKCIFVGGTLASATWRTLYVTATVLIDLYKIRFCIYELIKPQSRPVNGK